MVFLLYRIKIFLLWLHAMLSLLCHR